jgi:chemotaxis signal transduction protein
VRDERGECFVVIDAAEALGVEPRTGGDSEGAAVAEWVW